MTLEFSCDQCQSVLQAPEEQAGSEVQCPECQAVVAVPTAVEAAAGAEHRLRRSGAFPLAVLAAAMGASIGALVWAGVAYFFAMEIGWIAWAVGGLAGVGAAAVGNRSPALPLLCGLIALGGILAGKVLALALYVEKAKDEVVSEALTREMYEAWAEAAASPDPADGHPQPQAPSKELPTYEEWRSAAADEVTVDAPLLDLVLEDLEIADLVFAALGVITAFGIVRSAQASSEH